MSSKKGWKLDFVKRADGCFDQRLSMKTEEVNVGLWCGHHHATQEQALACEFKENFVIADPHCCDNFRAALKEGMIWVNRDHTYLSHWNWSIKFCPFCGKEIEKVCS